MTSDARILRIALLGATGGIGGHVLSWALDAGHEVQALARTPAALRPAPGLAVVQGDALDAESVARVVDGAQAVVCALGPRGVKVPGLLARAADATVAAMAKAAARRLVCVSAAGAYVAADPDMNWLVKAVLPRVLAATFADVREMEETVRGSGLDWTLVRASRLTNKPLTGQYRVAQDHTPGGGRKIARADVAHFIAHALTEDNWLHSAPALAY